MQNSQFSIFRIWIEGKYRMFYCFLCLLWNYIICCYYQNTLIIFFIYPLTQLSSPLAKELIVTGITEGIIITIWILLGFSGLFWFPFFIYCIWVFFIPGITIQERKKTRFWLVGIGISTIFWCVFIYNIAIPQIWEFFSQFVLHSDVFTIQFEPQFIGYTRSVGLIGLLGFGFLIIGWAIIYGLLSNQLTVHNFVFDRKYVFLGNMLWASIIAPPDLFWQLGFTLFGLLCYEFFYAVSFYIYVCNNSTQAPPSTPYGHLTGPKC